MFQKAGNCYEKNQDNSFINLHEFINREYSQWYIQHEANFIRFDLRMKVARIMHSRIVKLILLRSGTKQDDEKDKMLSQKYS